MGNGSVSSGDDWKYRGRGIIQVTGKDKYQKINDTIKKFLPDYNKIIDANSINNIEEGTIASMAYWVAFGARDVAQKGNSVDIFHKTVDIVNKNTGSREKRVENFKKCLQVFKVGSCNIIRPPVQEASNLSLGWHEPIKNPVCTLYMQSGGGGKSGEHWGLFGNTRNGKLHQGLDIFAVVGTHVYACVDSEVYEKRWHKGYGHTLALRVKDKEAFMARRREYKLAYEKFGEKLQSSNFDTSKDIFLFYAHLDKILIEKGDLVKAGDKIATSGTSGVTSGTSAPHLHFEIFTTRYAIGEGLNFRCNPGLYVYFRNIYQMSDAEKILQKETAKKRH